MWYHQLGFRWLLLLTDWWPTEDMNTISKLNLRDIYRTLAPIISKSAFFTSISDTLIWNDHVLVYKAGLHKFQRCVSLKHLKSWRFKPVVYQNNYEEKNLSALKNDKQEYKFHWLWLTNRPAFGHNIIDFTFTATVQSIYFKCLGTGSSPHTPFQSHIPSRSGIFTLGSSSVKTVIKSLIWKQEWKSSTHCIIGCPRSLVQRAIT